MSVAPCKQRDDAGRGQARVATDVAAVLSRYGVPAAVHADLVTELKPLLAIKVRSRETETAVRRMIWDELCTQWRALHAMGRV